LDPRSHDSDRDAEEPSFEGKGIAQIGERFERTKKDVVHHVFNFAVRTQEPENKTLHGVDIAVVKGGCSIRAPFQNRLDECLVVPVERQGSNYTGPDRYGPGSELPWGWTSGDAHMH
jgi:hypothetical protein